MAYLRHAACDATDPDGIARLAADLALAPGSLAMLFASPESNIERLLTEVSIAFAGVAVVGCTTAGEISGEGYASGQIVAIGFPRAHFACATVPVPSLSRLDPHELAADVLAARAELAHDRPDLTTEFAVSLVDGLSLREDQLSAALSTALGPAPLFGGSAGDGTDFDQAFVLHDGRAMRDAAVLTLVRTDCRVRVFKLDHLSPTDCKMVVTGADPDRRIVTEINAEPAAREYARILGKDPAQLTSMTFAAHPVLVRIGDQHHVRAVQRIDERGNLVFFSAIDVGVVLTLAEAAPIARHLDAALVELDREAGLPASGILAFDCILRRIEAEERQLGGEISHILRRHRAVGFNTYGEQINAMHVNQTLTGVAVYPPRNDGNEKQPADQSR